MFIYRALEGGWWGREYSKRGTKYVQGFKDPTSILAKNHQDVKKKFQKSQQGVKKGG